MTDGDLSIQALASPTVSLHTSALAVLGARTSSLLLVVACAASVSSGGGSRSGLMVALSLVAVLALVAAAIDTPRLGHWVATVISWELVVSAALGLMALLAMPSEPDAQLLVGALTITFFLTAVVTASSSLAQHLAASVPAATLGSIAFLVDADGVARWLGGVLGIACVCGLVLGTALRRVDRELAASVLGGREQTERMRAESRSLRQVNARLGEANRYLDQNARRDAMTGLLNREAFTDVLTNQFHHPGMATVALYCLDLDDFKRVNDNLGHRAGDLVLRAVAGRVRSVLTEAEIIARSGGDELVVLSTAATTADGYGDLGRTLLAAFETPFRVGGNRVELRVSIGMAVFDRAALVDDLGADDLMNFADAALHRAKLLGGGRIETFDDEMRIGYEVRRRVENELPGAFERGEISPYLQPIVEIASGSIVGAEALARWEHPSGARPAASFIDATRSLGLIDRLNTLVVDRVRRLQAQWSASGISCVPIAVNVSPMRLEAVLERFLDQHPDQPITIEITEDGSFADIERARQLLDRARDQGVAVLLDDFGTGFASLSVATELPLDGFKIDRCFVAALEEKASQAAVEAILQVARRMNVRVIAEGVESVEQLLLLRDLGVDYAQGYLYAAAMAPSEFEGLLASGFRYCGASKLVQRHRRTVAAARPAPVG